jgi:hypothetical protein
MANPEPHTHEYGIKYADFRQSVVHETRSLNGTFARVKQILFADERVSGSTVM